MALLRTMEFKKSKVASVTIIEKPGVLVVLAVRQVINIKRP